MNKPEPPRSYGDFGPIRIFDDPTQQQEMRVTSFYAEMAALEEKLDGADEDTLKFTTTRTRALVRVPRRLRLAEWWRRRRRSKKVQAMLDEVARREDARLLYGDDLDNSEWLREDW